MVGINWYVSDPNEFIKNQPNWRQSWYERLCLIQKPHGQITMIPHRRSIFWFLSVIWRKWEDRYSSWTKLLSTTTNTIAFVQVALSICRYLFMPLEGDRHCGRSCNLGQFKYKINTTPPSPPSHFNDGENGAFWV